MGIYSFWVCSCCGNTFDGALEQPLVILENNCLECALCDVVNAERALSDLEN